MPDAPRRACLVATCPHTQPCPVHAQQRARRPHLRLYDTRAWRTLARAFLLRNPFCVMCKARHTFTLATEVDHITPHDGNVDLFWDATNWQALCGTCHKRKTRTEVHS